MSNINTKILFTMKTERGLKEKAQKIARDLGLSLGTLVNALLKQFIRDKGVFLSVDRKPNKELIKSIHRANLELKRSKLPKAVDVEGLLSELNS